MGCFTGLFHMKKSPYYVIFTCDWKGPPCATTLPRYRPNKNPLWNIFGRSMTQNKTSKRNWWDFSLRGFLKYQSGSNFVNKIIGGVYERRWNRKVSNLNLKTCNIKYVSTNPQISINQLWCAVQLFTRCLKQTSKGTKTTGGFKVPPQNIPPRNEALLRVLSNFYVGGVDVFVEINGLKFWYVQYVNDEGRRINFWSC